MTKAKNRPTIRLGIPQQRPCNGITSLIANLRAGERDLTARCCDEAYEPTEPGGRTRQSGAQVRHGEIRRRKPLGCGALPIANRRGSRQNPGGGDFPANWGSLECSKKLVW